MGLGGAFTWCSAFSPNPHVSGPSPIQPMSHVVQKPQITNKHTHAVSQKGSSVDLPEAAAATGEMGLVSDIFLDLLLLLS